MKQKYRPYKIGETILCTTVGTLQGGFIAEVVGYDDYAPNMVKLISGERSFRHHWRPIKATVMIGKLVKILYGQV